MTHNMLCPSVVGSPVMKSIDKEFQGRVGNVSGFIYLFIYSSYSMESEGYGLTSAVSEVRMVHA